MPINPYQSPDANLTATESRERTRPLSVKVAVWLTALSFIVGLVYIFIEDGMPHSLSSAFWLLAFIAFTSSTVLGLFLRRNWVRWVYVALVSAGLLLLPWQVARRTHDIEFLVYLVQSAMQGVAVVLLVLPTSGRWYRPNNSFKPNPLRGSA